MSRLPLLALALFLAAACDSGSILDHDAGGGDGGHPPDAGGGVDVLDPPALYPTDRTLSPISPSVVRSLTAIDARGASLHGDVFAKVGDSITVSTAFMNCFAGTNVNLAGRTELQPTIDLFKAGDAAGTNPFVRVSLAASVGKTAGWAITGAPSPLTQETAAIAPRYALVMFGTNDVGNGTAYIHTFAANMLTLVDQLMADGTVPILSSIPPRDDNATVDLMVPRYNEVVRAIAQGRQIPIMDLHRELMSLPDHGLLTSDHVHPNSYAGGACVFTNAGLQYGYNVRNLISLESLARTRAAVEGGTASDPPSVARVGDGTHARPIVIDALPFVDLADTSRSTSTDFTFYSCAPSTNESGPEYVYQIVLNAPSALRATVFVRGNVDVDIQLLSDLSSSACLMRNDKEIFATSLNPGTYYLVVDSYVPADGVARAGEYILSVMAL